MTRLPLPGSRLRRWLGALGRAIRDSAEPVGIGNTVAEDGDHRIDAVGGVMIAGAGHRFGEAANEGSGSDGPPDTDG